MTASLLKSLGFFSVFSPLNNAVVWIVSVRPAISNSSSPFIKPLEIGPSAPFTNGITVIFMFHTFYSSLVSFKYLSLILPSFQSAIRQDSKVHDSAVYFYLFYYCYSFIRAFQISVSRWFFTGVWIIASLLKSPGLFLVFWPFSIMLSFGWSPLVPIIIIIIYEVIIIIISLLKSSSLQR